LGWVSQGLESRHLESRPKVKARLDLEVSVGWVSLSSRGLWGGDTLLLASRTAQTLTQHGGPERSKSSRLREEMGRTVDCLDVYALGA
jgi:hypothetical protein